MGGADVILDTHIIKKIIKEEELREKIFTKIKERCHNLIIAPLESEYRTRIEPGLNFKTAFKTELRGKFIQERPPVRRIKCGLKKGDKKLAGTAIKRAEKSGNAIIITEDPDFWRNRECFKFLKKHGVDVMSINEFLSE